MTDLFKEAASQAAAEITAANQNAAAIEWPTAAQQAEDIILNKFATIQKTYVQMQTAMLTIRDKLKQAVDSGVEADYSEIVSEALEKGLTS